MQSLLAAYIETEGRVETDPSKAEECASLAQLITDIMCLRPRLDLDAESFDAAFASSTLSLRLTATVLHRVLGAHVAATEDSLMTMRKAAAAARGDVPDGQLCNGSADRAPGRMERVAGRRECALLALQLMAQLTALTDELHAAAVKAGGDAITPEMCSRLQGLVLAQALHMSDALCLPPPARVAAAGSGRSKERTAPRVPGKRHWLDGAVVTASVEARAAAARSVGASSGAGGDRADLALSADELRRQPSLLTGADECAALRLVYNELAQLRSTLRRARPRLSWVPWVTLLPQMKTSLSDTSQPAAKGSDGAGHMVRNQRARQVLAAAKRFAAQLSKDGASAARGEAGAAGSRSLLQLLMAERQECLP